MERTGGQRFPVHSQEQTARKHQVGKAKHLLMLREDVHARSTQMDPYDMMLSMAEASAASAPSSAGTGAGQRAAAAESFEPAYVERTAEAAQLSKAVNRRRTPAGSFFAAVNPALASDAVPSTQPPQSLYTTQLRRTAGLLGDEDKLAATTTSTTEPAPSSAEPALGATAASLKATWLMPLESGDRKAAIEQARAVHNRRSASGGFYLERPPVIKI